MAGRSYVYTVFPYHVVKWIATDCQISFHFLEFKKFLFTSAEVKLNFIFLLGTIISNGGKNWILGLFWKSLRTRTKSHLQSHMESHLNLALCSLKTTQNQVKDQSKQIKQLKSILNDQSQQIASLMAINMNHSQTTERLKSCLNDQSQQIERLTSTFNDQS